MILPTTSCDSIRLNPSYQDRSDRKEMETNMNHSLNLAQWHIQKATKRGSSVADKVNAQMQMIYAQRYLYKAEYFSHQVCPQVHMLHLQRVNEREQVKKLNELRGQLFGTGFLNMLSRNGISGIVTYVRSSLMTNKL